MDCSVRWRQQWRTQHDTSTKRHSNGPSHHYGGDDIGDCSDLWRQRWRQRLNNDIIRTRTRLLVRSRSGSIDDGNGGSGGGSGGSGNCIGGRSSGEAIERLLNSFTSSATFKHVTSTCAQSQWQRKRRRAAMMAVSSVMASVAAAVATVAAAVVTRSTQAKACLCRLQPR